ncbi:nucleobase-ascorbate transporter 12 [Silene latifolia]|uniref:nucleobase-ascorbate transporter 12 n=1 Tax=Silene latifolia TaxID=37657 RepID=UPI003D7836A0
MSSSDPNKRPKPGPWQPPAPDSKAIPPTSWAKRTGFRPKFSGETTSTSTHSGVVDIEAGRARPLPPSSNGGGTTQPSVRPTQQPCSNNGPTSATPTQQPCSNNGPTSVTPKPPMKKSRDLDGETAEAMMTNGNGEGSAARRRPGRSEDTVEEDDDAILGRQSHIKYELRDTPGLVPIGLYGLQQYISILGSIILIPLVIVPAMGGSYEDTANVVSTVLFITGITTLLHTFFATRLPLIQGPSYVYLAPALAIINSPEFQKLNANNFKHIMKELQGAIIVASAFQAFLGYSGLMSLLVRVINPVVVAPTIAAVGLSFYSYGFPQVGTCLEIGAVQIILVIIFSLYLRKISILGHRIFLIYAVPLGLAITWATAFLLTEAGAYNFKGCDPNVPHSNIISDHCKKHIARMKQCRVDTSHALKMAPWFRFPYPLQWGTPVFSWKMALVMCAVSVIASVDSIGSYHASSLLVASRPPTPGVLSRGIGMEGLCSVLAGIWGTGTGSTTLTENVHTIAVTKMGSRRAIELGACVLIVFSLIGKVGGFLASIPQVMVAALLCFMWAMLTALGLSNLRYSEAGSSRNIIIVGLSLFFSLSIPAYFQQYGISPNSNVSVPSYFLPYIVASHGPVHTKYGELNYVLNTLLSFHMIIAFLAAVILDNTVPGSRQERGVYVWSESEAARREPAVIEDYGLPFKVGRAFRWVKWVGL